MLRVIARLEANPLSRKGSIPNVRKRTGTKCPKLLNPCGDQFTFFSLQICVKDVCYIIKFFLSIYRNRELINSVN